MNNGPYPGLRPFTKEESGIFFGRETHSDQLIEKLSHSRFVAVLGLSGCGKSSLVQAGMIAGLESGYLTTVGSNWHILAMRPGNHPMWNLAKILLELLDLKQIPQDHEEGSLLTKEELFARTIASHGPMGLVKTLQKVSFSGQTNFLLLVDQFEEIFRYPQYGNQDEHETFVTLLLNSVEQQELPIYVVVTMRSDYIGDCSQFPGLPEMMDRGQYLTPRLTLEQLRTTILGPARIFGGDVDPRLMERLLNETSNDPDILPVLQHCLMRMWYVAKENIHDGNRLTLKEYETVGGIKGALSRHADEVFSELTSKQQKIAEVLFRRITERGQDLRDRRHPVRIDDIASVAKASIDEVIAVAEKFRYPDRCFITPVYPEILDSKKVLDITHESLIRKWIRLKKWVEDETELSRDYLRLEETACLWKQGKAGLWGELDVERALQWKEDNKPTPEWAERYGKHFNLVIEFLDDSVKAVEAQHLQEERLRQNELRRTRQQRTWAIIGLICALLLAGWALFERINAEKARNDAIQASILAEKRQEEAENARDMAQKAQEEAESRSLSFREMVNATFGFLADTGSNKQFLAWIEETSTIDKLVPALHLMVDLSESISEEEKQSWHSILPIIPGSKQSELLDILGNEAVKKAREKGSIDREEISYSVPFHMQEVFLIDSGGSIIKPTYMIKPGEIITIGIENYRDDVTINGEAIRGKVEILNQKIIYMAPNKPGARDQITIKTDDLEGNTLGQLKIKIEISTE